jgi:hypothetical protein
LLSLGNIALAQSPSEDSIPSKNPFVVKMQQRGADEAVRSRQLFEREQISRKQRRLLKSLDLGGWCLMLLGLGLSLLG